MTAVSRHDTYRLPLLRRLSAPFRILPDFIILGAQKAGTTTLYDNLVKHSLIAPASIKEIHFFDNNWQRGIGWYKSHFPCASQVKRADGSKMLTGEGSPYYLYHPLAAERMQTVLPRVRLLVVLRNPVERAYSHYQHEVRKGREPLPFDEAIEKEAERLAGSDVVVLSGEPSFAHQHHSYISRGFYAAQLQQWFSIFPQEQFCILTTDELNDDFEGSMKRVHGFLNVPHEPLEAPKRSNVGVYETMNSATKSKLQALFAPHNRELELLLDTKVSWDE